MTAQRLTRFVTLPMLMLDIFKKKKKNKAIEPTLCTFPGCKSGITWTAFHTYEKHPRRTHRLMTAKSREPYRPVLMSPEIALSCQIGGTKLCNTSFQILAGLKRHLRGKVHQVSEGDVEKQVAIARETALGDEADSSVD